MNAQPESNIHLHGRWLLIARTAWLAWAILVVALFVFARRSDDWLALFVAFTLVTFGLATGPESLDQLAAGYPAWWLPVQFILFIGSVSILIFFYFFPNGQFVPRWTRWLAILWIVP